MTAIFISYETDDAKSRFNDAVLRDDAEGAAKISNALDRGNQVFNSWAVETGGTAISAGSGEGVIIIPAIALNDLQQIKAKYETAVDNTACIGVGRTLSQSQKALLAGKLRGKSRVCMFDKDVEKEVDEAAKEEEDNGEEPLQKRQPIHHVGKGGKPGYYHGQKADADPEVQQKATLREMPKLPESVVRAEESSKKPPKLTEFENSFRQVADQEEKKDNSATVAQSTDINSVKQKVAEALQAVQKQLPVLAEIKQASPETYTAVLGVIQGLIAIGKQLQVPEKMSKGEVNVTHNSNLPPTGMLGTSIGGLVTYDLGLDKKDLLPGGLADSKAPVDFDQEQLAIGTQHEMEHTDDTDLAREIAMDHLTEDPNYYRQEMKEAPKVEDLQKDKLKEQELVPSEQLPPETVLDKEQIPEHLKAIKAHHNTVPGQALDSRHIVVTTPAGNKGIRQVASGMIRDGNSNAVNPVGPGNGNVTSARNKPVRS